MAYIKWVVNNARKKVFTCHKVKRSKAAHISQPPSKIKKVLNKVFFLQNSIVTLGDSLVVTQYLH